jgi:hypothetical protein
MSMRIWLPSMLGLILVGLIGLMVTLITSRGQSTSRHPAEPAAVDEPPRLVTPRAPSSRPWAISEAPAAPTAAPAPAPEQAPAVEAEARAVEANPQATERDQQVAKLRASGPDAESLTAKVNPLQVAWEKMANQSGIEIDVSSCSVVESSAAAAPALGAGRPPPVKEVPPVRLRRSGMRSGDAHGRAGGGHAVHRLAHADAGGGAQVI